MTGLKFWTGPFGFPGFGKGVKIPVWISSGYSPSPVSHIVFRRSVICLCNFAGPYLISSAFKSSIPVARLHFRDFTAFMIYECCINYREILKQ